MIELLVVLALVGVLCSLLLPALSKAKAHARGLKCQSNLRQLMAGWIIAIDERDGMIPLTLNPPMKPGEMSWRHLLSNPSGVGPRGVFDAARIDPAGHPQLADFAACPELLRRDNTLGYAAAPFGYGVNTRWEFGMPLDPLVLPGPNEHQRWWRIRNPSSYPWLGDSRVTSSGVVHRSLATSNKDLPAVWGVRFEHGGPERAAMGFADGHAAFVASDEVAIETDGEPRFFLNR